MSGRENVELLPIDDPVRLGHTGPVVYFLEAVGTGRVKVGFTEDPFRRVLEIRTSCPYPVRVLSLVPGSRRLESAYHAEWAHRRVCGEWFEMDDDEMIDLAKLRDDVGREVTEAFVFTCMCNGEPLYRYSDSSWYTEAAR